MAEKYDFVMDPCGDVVLILKHPDSPFAVWDEDSATIADDPSPADDHLPVPDTDRTFLLSSRHLCLASPVLKVMLSGGWIEGIKSAPDGLYQLTAEHWDSEALAVVMNVVHGRWNLVPREISVEMLAKLAVIVDYYDIHEPLQLILHMWMTPFSASSIPTRIGRELVLWLLIAWVFKNDVLFLQAAKVAILRSTDEIRIPMDVPIPSSVIKGINTRRDESIKDIAGGLKELVHGYIVGQYGCDFECSSIELGALMKGLHKVQWAYERPSNAPQFGNLSLAEVVTKLRTIRCPVWTKVPDSCCCSSGRRYSYGNSQTCQKAHECLEEIGVFEVQDFRLRVGEDVTTCTSGGLVQHIARLVESLESRIVITLEQFGFGVGS
ncbi:hypothetical protein QBC47DRAFT_409896 [Echria macrotheca]|uniref:BTB domain-containing protein n=1 Tax=Echria macrotheca TaxID=438768 RepID=A0AAJ0BJI1_9PEZI|nr:hypothetical protein QBC47DRAFT_409896 [Echria macrotheca]